jgi:hypothetical protein
MDLKEIGCEGVDWFHLAQHRDLLIHGNEPLGSIKGRQCFDQPSDY